MQTWSTTVAQLVAIVMVLAILRTSTGYQYCTGRATGWAIGKEEAAAIARRWALDLYSNFASDERVMLFSTQAIVARMGRRIARASSRADRFPRCA